MGVPTKSDGFLIFAGVWSGPHERRLINDLMKKYNNLERPVANESEALVLKFGLTLQQIIDVVSLHNIVFSRLRSPRPRSGLKNLYKHIRPSASQSDVRHLVPDGGHPYPDQYTVTWLSAGFRGNGEKLSSSQAEPGQAIKSAVA